MSIVSINEKITRHEKRKCLRLPSLTSSQQQEMG